MRYVCSYYNNNYCYYNYTHIYSIAKFLIMIGVLYAYLSCNRRAIMWVSNYRCLI